MNNAAETKPSITTVITDAAVGDSFTIKVPGFGRATWTNATIATIERRTYKVKIVTAAGDTLLFDNDTVMKLWPG